MSEDEAFRLVHILALFVYVAGIGATILPLTRAWSSDDLEAQLFGFQAAARYQAGVLLPGIILVGVSGAIWAIRSDQVDPIETGWLLAVEALYLVGLFVLVPGMVAGLRRVRLLALQARKQGEITEELAETLADRGPLVFAIILLLLLPVQTALAVIQP